MNNLFQTITLSITSDRGTQTSQFIGRALFTKEQFEEIKDKPLAELVTDFRITAPEEFSEVESEFGDMIDDANEPIKSAED